MTQPWQLSARAIAQAVSGRQLGAEEVARSVLQRLDAVNPRLNAVIGHDEAWSLAQARAVDARLAAGEAGEQEKAKRHALLATARRTKCAKLVQRGLASDLVGDMIGSRRFMSRKHLPHLVCGMSRMNEFFPGFDERCDRA